MTALNTLIVPQRLNLIVRFNSLVALALAALASGAQGAVTAQYIRVENPTGFVMEVRQIEVFSGGKNVVRGHRDMVCGTVPPLKGDDNPTPQSIIVDAPREGNEITNGDTNIAHRASEWRAYANPVDNALNLNPWFEINLGQPLAIDKIVIYGSRYPERIYLDKGHRVVSALDKDRRVVWADKWQYYDQKKYPKGVFEFEPVPGPLTLPSPQGGEGGVRGAGKGSVVGAVIPAKANNWVAMGWLLDAENSPPPPDAARRRNVFAARNTPEEIKKLAERFFPLLDERILEIAAAKKLHAAGRHAEALTAWKRYWFAKMARVNLHAALHDQFVTYDAHGDDLLNGLLVAITPGTAKAIRYTPGEIYWINLPAGGNDRELNAALDDCKAKAAAGKMSWPLLYSFRRKPEPAYIQRWAEIMDDWSLNFFADAAQTPHEVEDLFTFNPCLPWGTMMEDLSDIAKERPALVDLVPATTLARVQLICLEKYSTAWWRQARETIFNHVNGGVYAWDTVLPYIDEFHPGQRARQEWRQAFERFITLATEPDGSLAEIGDEGHQEIPVLLGFNLQRAELTKPAWYTPGWRNRALEWYDNLYKYMFRHLAPGGYEHRFAVDYRPQRWESTTKPYFSHHPQAPPMLSRDKEIFGDPEIRRMLDAFGHISSGVHQPADPVFKPIAEKQQKSHDLVLKVLGADKPGMPHVLSDWMPYTGAYYFRGSWEDDAPFLGMMACGSHGGSQAPQWPYTMFYFYDYGYPLVAAKPVLINGLPPDYLQGRRHTYEPGTKTMALTNADEKPAKHRWLSSPNFDFGEAYFHGNYQNFPSFKKNWDYNLEIVMDGPVVTGVDSLRQIVQVRGCRLFIVTDALRIADKTPRDLTIPYTFSLSTRQKNPSRPFGPEQLQLDPTAGIIRSDNPDGPSVTLYQFSGQPLAYRKGQDAKPDPRRYSSRLTDQVPIAEQQVAAEVKSDHLALVSLISSIDKGAKERFSSVEPANQGSEVVGFHAELRDGGQIWYQSVGLGTAKLACGPAAAEGQVLLVVKDKSRLSGLLLGGKSLAIAGKAVVLRDPDCEFAVNNDGVTTAAIYTPIDPVSFKPGRNTFSDSEKVEMASATPNVEIRYTTDGSPPARTSKLYSGPVTITESTEFAARAYRLGPDGKPLPAEDFEINGTKFTVPTYGWFYKRPLQAAAPVAEQDLVPGLRYERLQAPWWSLYASAHWLPAAGTGTVAREMEQLQEPAPEPYGMRYKGYIRIPTDGVYSFHAPHELVYMDYATSYDLRVYVDGEEWYLTQWWHGHGTWSVPLKKGFHAFQVDFSDARTNPWRKSGIWRYYPRPWAIYPGKPGDIQLSGPGMEQPARIPQDWLFREK